MNRLNPSMIQDDLGTVRIGRRVMVFDSLDSTNSRAWQFANQSDSDGLCIFAECQTAGRGRHGRTWQCPPYTGLLFSVLLHDISAGIDLLMLAAAVAAAQALEPLGLNVHIKWPNDVLIDNKKVCGILVEKRILSSRPCCVLGMGINVLQRADFFDSQILDQPATSIFAQIGIPPDRNVLGRSVLQNLDRQLAECQHHPGRIIQHWKRYNRQIGQRIKLEQNQQNHTGTCIGLDPAEGLIVQLDSGSVRFFTAGDTHTLRDVRGG